MALTTGRPGVIEGRNAAVSNIPTMLPPLLPQLRARLVVAAVRRQHPLEVLPEDPTVTKKTIATTSRGEAVHHHLLAQSRPVDVPLRGGYQLAEPRSRLLRLLAPSRSLDVPLWGHRPAAGPRRTLGATKKKIATPPLLDGAQRALLPPLPRSQEFLALALVPRTVVAESWWD